MKFDKDCNPGSGNTFQEINIGHVENYNPAATTVVNNNYYYGTREKPEAEETPVEKSVIRQEILDYVVKTREFVLIKWKDKYMDLWNDILDIPEVAAIIYHRGRQSQTTFNRKEVCHIICYLGQHAVDGMGIFEKYNATHIARSFKDGCEKSTRPELGYKTTLAIRKAIDELLKTKKYQ